MADVRGFRAIRYDDEKFGADKTEVVAPPYDVINDEEQAALYEEHPNNIIRLILNRQQESDTDANNRYTRSRRHLMDWLAEGVLSRDPKRALYPHYQTFEDIAGREHTRRGFLGLVRLQPYSDRVILPHEQTLRGPKEDRLKLMKACECNMSPIFLLYDDPEHRVDQLLAEQRGDARLDVTTEHDGIRHQSWRVDDGEAVCKVAGELDDKQMLIADGHHRYETALGYQEFRRSVEEEPRDEAPYDYALAFFANMHDPGLQVFPTHRMVYGVDGFDADELREALTESPHMHLEVLSEGLMDDPDALVERLEEAGESAPSFVFLQTEWDAPVLVQFTGDTESPVFDEETGESVRQLDTAILHEAVLDRMVGIDKEAQKNKTNLHYTRDLDEAMAGTADHQFVVLMNATGVDEVVDVCKSGGKMPQKSTYFYPKVLSGLAINPL
jgi:uncharacterized protein (DUF1015 family)